MAPGARGRAQGSAGGAQQKRERRSSAQMEGLAQFRCRSAAMMMLTLQPVRVAPAQARARSQPVRCAPVCSLRSVRERAGSALAAAALAAALAAPPCFAKAADFGVYWLSPADGATVSSPVAAKFGVKGLDVKPAGAPPPDDYCLRRLGPPLRVQGQRLWSRARV